MGRWIWLLLVAVFAAAACTSTGRVISDSVENETGVNESVASIYSDAADDDQETQNTRSAENQQNMQQNSTSNTTKGSGGGGSGGSSGSNANVDQCSGVVCQNSTRTCPDGFVASCRNACISGQCGTCVASCAGHETTDLCENVVCTNSTLQCPDSFNASCSNSCNQTAGLCSSCAPSCTDHCTPYERWSCTSWSACENGAQLRECADPLGNETNGCGYLRNETQNCTVVQPEQEKILITEVFYDTPGTESDEEWLEIYNPTRNSINMSGWKISDNQNNWSFPDNTVIENQTYLVIARDLVGFQMLYNCSPHISGFTRSLNNDGDQITVFNLTGAVDFVAWEGSHNNTYPEWSVNASVNKTIARILENNTYIDTDSPSDWLSNQTPTPACIA